MSTLNGPRRIALVAIAFVAVIASSQGAEPTTAVRVTEIGGDVQLIGRLGEPLGTMLTVVGTWSFPDQSAGPTKDYSLRFSISHVGGNRLPHPVVVPVHSVHVTERNGTNAIPDARNHVTLDGQRWTLRAYETGRFTVVPDEYWKHTGYPAMVPEPAFASEIVGIRLPGRKQE